MRPNLRRGWAEWLMFSCGIWHVGLGLYFIVIRPPLLPEDLRYMGTEAAAIASAVPMLADWLKKVFTVMGGFMAGAGVLIAHLGLEVMPARLPGTVGTMAAAGALTLGLMSAVNFSLHSDFRWILVVPPVVWAIAVVLYARERTCSLAR